MLDMDKAILKLNANAAIIADDNAQRFKRKETSTLKYGRSRCAHYVKLALIDGGLSSKNSGIESAKDYGPWLTENGFKVIIASTTSRNGNVYNISGQQKGDVVIVQATTGHQHGHIAMFNGSVWVSDFLQVKGFYPSKIYRDNNTPYALYRYSDISEVLDEPPGNKGRKGICYPVAKMNGQEFSGQEEMLAHLAGESTGLYMIGRNGMWHGGIHFTNATTPWCALSGDTASEKIDFPLAFKGEQAVRCMVDGEVVAYRICKDYLQIPWESGPLHCSGSFVLVRHYIQPGETEKSGLHFYTLYMHLAPYSAYEAQQEDNLWCVQERLAAYEPEWVMVAGSENKTVRDTYRKGTMPKGAIIEWDPADTNLHATAYNLRGYGLVTFKGLLAESQKKGEKTSLTPGQRYWMLVDRNNIAPATSGDKRPSWWKALLPPAREVMQFDQVVCPTPYAIGAGDSVGHLGYFQVAKDGGYEARYQVHIECISMDDNLPEFLKNPEQVGTKNPVWLKYQSGLELYKKDVKTGVFSKDDRTTTRSGILKLSKVPSEADKSSKLEYWKLPSENGYVLKGKSSPELLSQYDLGKLGFNTEISDSTSFDYLNGKSQPTGLLRNVFQSLLNIAKEDIRFSHALSPFNYQRILNKIDSGAPEYSPMEYFRALHNSSYRDVVLKTIVKHPSDWYHTKSDSIWQNFLEPLKKDAPEWKKYSEAFLDKMTWMQELSTVKLGPSLWHMHPVMFLGILILNKISISEARVRAFMRMIRVCEGTAGEEGYERLFGGESFIKHYHKTFSTHPQIKIKRKNKKTGKVYISSAAGAYQIMGYTWDDPSTVLRRKKYNIQDFTPESQDLLCVVILKEKVRDNALNMIIDNEIKKAIQSSCSYEWASLPPSRHNQPTKTLDECLKFYESFLMEELAGKTSLKIENGFLKRVLK